jgi:tRNA (guanine-N7-)-methyltransferase
MRRVRAEAPDDATAAKYLHVWSAGELYNHPERFPSLTSEVLFGNSKPLELEIGCSTAEFLCEQARRNPDHNFLGIEISLKPLHYAVQNAASMGLDNIMFLKAPAQETYRLMEPNSLHTVYMHFPDPALHPKFRKRKLLTRSFLDRMQDLLVPGGILSLVTDKEELFEDVLNLIEREPRFERTHPERYLLGYEPHVKSRYQVYWEKHGSTIYRVELRNLKAATP